MSFSYVPQSVTGSATDGLLLGRYGLTMSEQCK